MATTTPNFGWAVPTSTDLVKDGAVAIETLGDSIDASLVDLKGGTTGQVLAKASGTDMDFSWVTDATGIPATIFDAKGDIIAATAADTAARLALGTDGQVLTVDTSTATGLKYATPSGGGTAGAWTAYTPTVSAGTGTLTSASATGAYYVSGKLCIVRINIVLTTNGTGAGVLYATLPFTPIAAGQVGNFRETNVNGKQGTAMVIASTARADLRNYDNTYPGADGTGFTVSLSYETV